jgi:hypothetical protein
MYHEPKDLLVECKSCGAESHFTHYMPETNIACAQCREPLLDLDLNESHDEYVCEDCGYTQLLLKDTPFDPDTTACRCGSDSIIKMDSSSIAEEAEEAGALDKLDDDETLDDDEPLEEEDDEEELDDEPEEDWLRSDPRELGESDDYDEAMDSESEYN